MVRFRVAGEMIVGRLDPDDEALLGQLPILVGSVGGVDDDPALARLTPDVHPGDREASRAFTGMVADDLERARSSDRRFFEDSLSGGRLELTRDEAEAWVRLIGDARLILAARAGVLDQAELPSFNRSSPEVTLVHYLGAVQDELVTALAGALESG